MEQGGGHETPPLSICSVTIFRKDFALSRKPVMCCHLGFDPRLEMIKIQRKLKMFDDRLVEYDIIKHFAALCQHLALFSPKTGKKSIFLVKWLNHLLLMTSYLVNTATDSHQTCIKMCLNHLLLMMSYLVNTPTDSHQTWIKMCLRDMHIATESRRYRWKIVLEKFKKYLMGKGGIHLTPCTSEGKE